MRNIQPRWMKTLQPKCGACCVKNGCLQGLRSTSSRCVSAWHMDTDAQPKLQSLTDFLSSVEILSPFTRDELERLAEHAESRFFSFGDAICNAGDPADGLFVIKS